jgi:hypothetical protein
VITGAESLVGTVRHDDMALYRVTIHGSNFRLKLEGKWEKFRFYTPRVADAPDEVVAEQVALEDFRQSQKYQELLASSLNSAQDPPFVRGEDVTQVSERSGKVPAGLALYRESDVYIACRTIPCCELAPAMGFAERWIRASGIFDWPAQSSRCQWQMSIVGLPSCTTRQVGYEHP